MQAVIGVPGAKRGTYSQTAGNTDHVTITIDGARLTLAATSSAPRLREHRRHAARDQAFTPLITSRRRRNTFTVTAADAAVRAAAMRLRHRSRPMCVRRHRHGADLPRTADSANRTGTVAVPTATGNGQDRHRPEPDADAIADGLQLLPAGLPVPRHPRASRPDHARSSRSPRRRRSSARRTSSTTASSTTPSASSGLGSFKSGGTGHLGRSAAVDGQSAPAPGRRFDKPGSHNNNLNALIDELNTQLMGGQLPSTASITTAPRAPS